MNKKANVVQLLRKREASERLKISERQLEVFIAQGKLRVHRFGRRCVRIDESELVRFVQTSASERVTRSILPPTDKVVR